MADFCNCMEEPCQCHCGGWFDLNEGRTCENENCVNTYGEVLCPECVVLMDDGSYLCRACREETNLHAAAKDLLVALEHLAPEKCTTGCLYNRDVNRGCFCGYERARDAILKARGKEPGGG